MKTILLIPLIILTLIQCKSAKVTSSQATLENTYWKLSEMNGNPVFTPDGVREAHFILSAEGNIKGFAGCNSLAGSYTLTDKKINFTVITTKMMCPPEQMEIETFFTKVLSSANTYKIEGETLELFEGNTALAEFKSVYLK